MKILNLGMMMSGVSIVFLTLSLSLLFSFGAIINGHQYYQEAFGHAFVIDTNPVSGEVLTEPPANINAFINEPVDLTYSKITVIDSNGEQVDTGQLSYIDNDQSKLTTTLPPDIVEGTYTVSVQMLSQIDGHLTQDTFVFGVGEQGDIALTSAAGQEDDILDLDQISTGSAIARFPALVGQVMIVGAAFCMMWLWRPIMKLKWLNEKFIHARIRIEYRTVWLMIIGAIILIVSDFAMILSLAISINASILDTIDTTFGSVWLLRTILSFAILILTVIPLFEIRDKKKLSISKQPFASNNRLKYVITSIIFALGLATLLTTSLMGHAAAVSASILPVSLDFVHNIVASLWIGGVIYLAFVVAPILKQTISSKGSIKIDKKHESYDNINKKAKKQKDDSYQTKKNNTGDDDYDFGLLTVDIADTKGGEYQKNLKSGYDPDNVFTVNSVLSLLIPKFSFVPVVILGVILLTGPFLLYILEDDLSLTIFSLYGLILLSKLILAAIMIFIGIYYQVVIHKQSLKQLTTYSSTSKEKSQVLELESKKGRKLEDKNNIMNKIISRFNFGLKAEAIIGILLLATVALLTNTGLPESETGIQGRQLPQDNLIDENTNSQGYTATRFFTTESFNNAEGVTSDNEDGGNNDMNSGNNTNSFIKARMTIEPFQPGNNKFIISFIDANNNPVDFIDDVDVRLTKIGSSIGSVSVSIAPIGIETKQVSTGVFTANATFGFPGQWQVEVEGITNLKNASNLYTVFDPFIKPSLEQMTFNITEYNSTSPIQPLYPVYDGSRNVIWVGDTILNSGRILEFNVDNVNNNNNANNFVQHNISGASVITQLGLDTNNTIWYIDPLRKVLGNYDPQTQSNDNYMLFDSTQPVTIGPVFSQSQATNQIQNQQQQQQQQQTQPPLSFSNATEAQGAPSALGIDSKNNVWIAIANTNIVLKFDTSNKTFTKIALPTVDANPLGVTVDEKDLVWIAEGGPAGKIAKIESTGNIYSVKEYSPKQSNPMSKVEDPTNSTVLNDPIFILPDPQGLELYISEHEGQAISVFNPITETFRQISLDNKDALPFGMVFDVYNNLWIAEHLTNKITVIDPVTEEQTDATIPGLNPFNQYLTTDSKGQVWAAEQRGNALARVDINVNPLTSSGTGIDGDADDGSSNTDDISGKISNLIETTGFERLVAPFIAVGIIIVALMYIRTVYTFSKSLEHVKKYDQKK